MTSENFKSLFDQYFEDIRRYLYYRCGDAELSTDLAQDIFLKIWEKKMLIRPGKDTGLLYKMASDHFINHVRKEKVRRENPERIRFEQISRTPEDDLNYRELQDKYEKALMRLSEGQRVVFLMSRMEELSYKEIATRLSLSVKAIEKRMSGALASLRNELKPDESETHK